MEKKSRLQYSIIICTYNRPDVLAISLYYCIQQTIAAAQIIIVDASDDWNNNRIRLLNDIKVPEGTEILYLEAEKKSSASQRNQGISTSRNVDILFFIDDDSFMYPESAERILALYAKDKEGLIAGIQGGLANCPPDAAIADSEVIREKRRFLSYGMIEKMEKYFFTIYKYIFLMSDVQLFIPYYGSYKYDRKVTVNGGEYDSLNFFHGCRMSFRDKLVRKNLFDEDLVKYSAGEDLDLSYRMSQEGHLIECGEAPVFHKTVAAGRLSRYKSTSMYSFNLALFIRKNSNNLNRDRKRYVILSLRRILAEFLKDLLSLRLSFPQLRGVIVGNYYGIMLLFKKKLDRQLVVNYLSQY
jgi:glycosyltransferase involved in cell wall biosynthesis